METINNLTYNLKINYVNDLGENILIDIKINDDGLETKSFQVGDVCVTEETISGRVLSGCLSNQKSYCGYKYNYERNDENYLVGTNPDVSISEAVSLINATKMDTRFLASRMVLSSIMRDDYRIFPVKQGNINVIKTIAAENEKNIQYFLQESLILSKSGREVCFKEIDKKRIYKKANRDLKTDDIMFMALDELLNKNINNYKELIETKNKIQTLENAPGF